MTLDEAREHVGETVTDTCLALEPRDVEIVSVGNHAVYVRLAGSAEIMTMHPRHLKLPVAESPATDWYVIVPGSPWGGKTAVFGPYPEDAARGIYARLAKPFVPECPPKLLRVVEDYGQTPATEAAS